MPVQLTRGRNLILCGTAGLGKTMIAKNIAHAAILAGHTALFRTVSDLLADLDRDSPAGRRRKFRFYARPSLLVPDEVGYLAYDADAADLLFEIVNHRYERNSVVLTTNKAYQLRPGNTSSNVRYAGRNWETIPRSMSSCARSPVRCRSPR